MTERNALAELAEDLEILKVILESEHHPKGTQVADKAQRIVAELANVKDIKEFGIVHVREDMAIDAVEHCRAIAEEGAKDEM